MFILLVSLYEEIYEKYIKADIKECTAYVFSFQSLYCKYCIKFLIHFKFVYGIKKQFSMILLLVAVQFSLTPFIEGDVFSLLYVLASFDKD